MFLKEKTVFENEFETISCQLRIRLIIFSGRFFLPVQYKGESNQHFPALSGVSRPTPDTPAWHGASPAAPARPSRPRRCTPAPAWWSVLGRGSWYRWGPLRKSHTERIVSGAILWKRRWRWVGRSGNQTEVETERWTWNWARIAAQKQADWCWTRVAAGDLPFLSLWRGKCVPWWRRDADVWRGLRWFVHATFDTPINRRTQY